MQKITEILKTVAIILLVILVVGAAIWGGYLVTHTVYKALAALQKEVAAAIVAVSGTVIVSVLSLVVSKMFDRKAEVQREIREKKAPVYEELMGFWARMNLATVSGKGQRAGKGPPSDREVNEFMAGFLKDIIVWGTDDVLKAFQNFRESARVAEADDQQKLEPLILFARLLLVIRKDLGHKNRDLTEMDILSLWVTDLTNLPTQRGSKGTNG